MAAQQILVLFVQVRILVGQLRKPDFTSGFLFLRINPKFLLFHTQISPKKEGFPVHEKWKAQVLDKYRLLFKHKYVHKGSLRFHNRSRTTLICFTIIGENSRSILLRCQTKKDVIPVFIYSTTISIRARKIQRFHRTMI